MDDTCWEVWPNPATNDIYLHLVPDCGSGIEVDKVVIHDLYGREVHRQRIARYSEVQMFDIGELPKGMYILRLQSSPVKLGVR